jgi:hypothetical protein
MKMTVISLPGHKQAPRFVTSYNVFKKSGSPQLNLDMEQLGPRAVLQSMSAVQSISKLFF